MYQAAIDDFDREIARLLGVNEVDLRCLEILLQETPEAAPSVLAARLGLATSSVTAMLDRLEHAGYVDRAPHPTDRRRTVVRATALVADRVMPLITPLVDEGRQEVLAPRTREQLRIVTEFLRACTDLQQRHTQRLRDIPALRSDRDGRPAAEQRG